MGFRNCPNAAWTILVFPNYQAFVSGNPTCTLHSLAFGLRRSLNTGHDVSSLIPLRSEAFQLQLRLNHSTSQERLPKPRLCPPRCQSKRKNERNERERSTAGENWIALGRAIETSLVSTQAVISCCWPGDRINTPLCLKAADMKYGRE